jgi:hypothetical protein
MAHSRNANNATSNPSPKREGKEKNSKLISLKVEVPAWKRYIRAGNFYIKSVCFFLFFPVLGDFG